MRRTLLLIAVTLVPMAPAAASNWVRFGQSSGRAYYGDANSITTLPNSIVRAWVKTDFSRDPSATIRYSLERWEVSCSLHQLRATSSIEYQPDGSISRMRQTPDAGFTDIIPDSVAQAFEEAVCVQRR